MESFMSSLFVMGLGSRSVDDIDGFDIVGQLPNEIGSIILRYLDGDSLLKAATISRRWNYLCRGDKKLRQRGRRHLRKMKIQRREQIYGGLENYTFVPVNENDAFKNKSLRNVNFNISITKKPVIEETETMVILRPHENILQKLKVNPNRSVAIKKPKPLSSHQKRRLLRH